MILIAVEEYYDANRDVHIRDTLELDELSARYVQSNSRDGIEYEETLSIPEDGDRLREILLTFIDHEQADPEIGWVDASALRYCS